MLSFEHLNDDDLCERGLELFLPSAYKRQQAKRHAIHLVLQEQFFAELQASERDDEEDEILAEERKATADFELAQAYREASYDGKIEAYLRGVNDARMAKNVWAQSMQECHEDLSRKTQSVTKGDEKSVPTTKLGNKSLVPHEICSLAA